MLKIDVEAGVIERVVPGKNGNFTVYSQVGYVHLPGKRYPVECQISLEAMHAKAGGWQAGSYHLGPESFDVGRYGDLVLKRQVILQKVGPSVAAMGEKK